MPRYHNELACLMAEALCRSIPNSTVRKNVVTVGASSFTNPAALAEFVNRESLVGRTGRSFSNTEVDTDTGRTSRGARSTKRSLPRKKFVDVTPNEEQQKCETTSST